MENNRLVKETFMLRSLAPLEKARGFGMTPYKVDRIYKSFISAPLSPAGETFPLRPFVFLIAASSHVSRLL
jgi:hypothetical protein